MKSHYDRIFLFSDMQCMDVRRFYTMSNHKKMKTPQDAFHEYTDKYGSCHIYSFDLGNYNNQIISDDCMIDYITMLNDKVFDVIKIIDEGKSLIDILEDYRY